ncbi:MAG: serpin family protein [Bacteroidales bacterium]
MLKFRKILPYFGFILLQFACNKEHTNDLVSKPTVIPDYEKIIIENSNRLGFDCFKQLAVHYENNENIIVSPEGISQSLYFLIKASDKNTKSEIKKSLKINEIKDSVIEDGFKHLRKLYSTSDYSSRFANTFKIALNNDVSLEKEFENLGNDNFKIETDENAGYIEVAETKENSFQLINSLNFSGKSKNQVGVVESPFYNSPNDTRIVKMVITDAKMNYYSDQTIQVFELAIGKGSLNFMALIPQNNETIGDICRKLDTKLFEKIKSKFVAKQMQVFIPEIEFKGIKSYRDILKSKVIPTSFKEHSADYSPISKSSKLFLSDFEQIIDFNLSSNDNESDLNINSLQGGSILVDHPFIFIIYEKYSGSILFLGKVVSI